MRSTEILSVFLGCQGLPVAVMVAKGHRDRRQRRGGGGNKPDTFAFFKKKKVILEIYSEVKKAHTQYAERGNLKHNHRFFFITELTP